MTKLTPSDLRTELDTLRTATGRAQRICECTSPGTGAPKPDNAPRSLAAGDLPDVAARLMVVAGQAPGAGRSTPAAPRRAPAAPGVGSF